LVAGFALAAMSVGWPLASAFSGRLYLRTGFRNTALLGAVISVAAAFGFVSLGLHSPVIMAALFSFLIGIGLGLGSTAIVVLIQSIVSWNRRGVVTGANMFTRQLGSTLGVAVYGSLVNASLAKSFRHPPAHLAALIPHNLNAASLVLGGVPNLPAAVVQYVQHALASGIHHVFLGVFAVAIFTVVMEWFLPKAVQTVQADTQPVSQAPDQDGVEERP
jgi:MFS family permease